MDLFFNAHIYTEKKLQEDLGFLTVKDGVIHEIHTGLPSKDLLDTCTQKWDCEGEWLLPGFVDTHVHFRDAGQKVKETVQSGTLGALCGGITTVLSMPNTQPPLSTPEALDSYLELIGQQSLFCNFGFYTGIKEEFDPSRIASLTERGIFGIKVYPGDGSDQLSLDWNDGWKTDMLPEKFRTDLPTILTHFQKTYDHWETLFTLAKKHDLPLIFHPELPRTPEMLLRIWKEGLTIAQLEQSTNPELYAHNVQHPIYTNELAHVEMVIAFIHKICPTPEKAPHLHFAHVSSSDAVTVIEMLLKEKGYPCSIEVTPHHMLLNYNLDLHGHPASYGKVLVPLRAPDKQEQMLKIVQSQRQDTIGTDHAPHTKEEKDQEFLSAPSGFPYIDFATQILLTKVHAGILPLSTVVNTYATNPAQIFNIANKGQIKPGHDADLVRVSKVDPYPLDPTSSRSKQKWTPWEGMDLTAKITQVWLKGTLGYDGSTEKTEPHGELIRPAPK